MPHVRSGNLNLYYEEEGSGEPLLLLMGLGGDTNGWMLVRRALAARYRVVLLDNRDAGRSDEAPAPYGLGDMADDALALLGELGIERFHVLGASMGGAIAQHLALRGPERVASLVLAATWARTDPLLAAIIGSWRIMVEKLEPREFLAAVSTWAFTHRFFQNPPPEILALDEQLGERALKSVAAYRRQADACLAHDLVGVLPLLTTPTLVLVGEDDILTPPRYARALATVLGRAEVMLVPATGHACFLETPKPFADRVLAFLAKRPI